MTGIFGIAVLYHFKAPIGVINASAGGSSIEPWLNRPPYETGIPAAPLATDEQAPVK